MVGVLRARQTPSPHWPPPPLSGPSPRKLGEGSAAPAQHTRRCRNWFGHPRDGGLDWFPHGADRPWPADPVGAGADGDPRGRPGLPAGTRLARLHSRCRAGCPLGAVGDGGGVKVRRLGSRDRRAVGRSGEPRFYRDAAAGGRIGAVGRSGLAGAARRLGESKRGADAWGGSAPRLPSRSTARAGAPAGTRAIRARTPPGRGCQPLRRSIGPFVCGRPRDRARNKSSDYAYARVVRP